MPRVSLTQLFLIFFRLGALGFGGPIALISLIEEEFVAKKKWIDSEKFNETYVFCKMLPGPVAYQMALWVGYALRGRIGGAIVAIGFLIPGVVLILVLTIFYSQIKHLPKFDSAFAGMRVGALLVIADSVLRMFTPYKKDRRAWAFVTIAAGLMVYLPRWEPILILMGGIISVGLAARFSGLRSFAPLSLLGTVFWVHFKAGAFVFGTGLAILPVLEADVVHHYHWLTRSEFLDGIAFGQVTPGPVTITSVFIGYKTAQYLGAFVALAGMYLPGTIMMLFIMPLLRSKLEGRDWLQQFQKGAIPTVIGCIMGATLLLAWASLAGPVEYVLLVVLGLVLWFTKLPAWSFIPMGAAISAVISLFVI